MPKQMKNRLSDNTIWILVVAVFFGLLVILSVVVNHERKKPKSPQEMVAAAFNQMFTIKEWQPGMGNKPFVYHPAATKDLVWKPLPNRQNMLQQQNMGGLVTKTR